ncbi:MULTISPECIES: DsbE family thiol:disulfide interchange protein [Corallincola]|uniref:DsbE family thiol:disulfide interchange protein n=3 Tax=Corallincola TaxID=1775176 RepID=A0A368N1W0_9GAMM|nr:MULTISPECIES: DsbE family thiol:disulfide interchange protein [Corallincola]RCU44537.1 DsbE family thiol:disulfide interchange protein [Corallincola holothuriorum]TAA40282.1 DsbE family thiol:disulfide interchange protein [Corallincola spongiicola]TCI05411.1 DsbE family thiol:disulfide interchange protein [Corallincola luteus]
MSRQQRLFVFLIPFLLFLGLAAFLMRGLFSDPRELESVLVGKPVPAFKLPDLYQPSVIRDQAVLAGQPTLLNVWATWCPTCRAEHAFLNELAATGVHIIGLNYKDDPVKAKQWLAQLGNPYAVNLLDVRGTLALDLGVYGAPETYIIDVDGVVVYRHVGDVNARNWKALLEPLYREASQSKTVPQASLTRGLREVAK